MAQIIVPGVAQGDVLVCGSGVSFWGGVDIATGRIVDPHHDQCGESLVDRVVFMPTSRGSCSGSSMLLDLALNDRAPATLIFHESEDILTLGSVVARGLFQRPIPIIRLTESEYELFATQTHLSLADDALIGDQGVLPLERLRVDDLDLSAEDRAVLAGNSGEAAKFAMETLCTMAQLQGADRLIDVTRAHIDGCIYASAANLIFAEKMAAMGGQVIVPTTMNAISVDYDNWRGQGTPASFGQPASRLAEAYVRMGARPSFTCAPYYLDDPPSAGENIGWSESNAVIYANSVLGARTAKHPDFMDLCIALTGRAPEAGVYLSTHRLAGRVIDVQAPDGHDDAFWPLLGWLVGKASPDRIPLLTGLEALSPSDDDLRALCAAFGTTSAAPMLHVAGITPEGTMPPAPNADHASIGGAQLTEGWMQLNTGGEDIDLVSFGSPHFSLNETRALAQRMAYQSCRDGVSMIVTLGRDVLARARTEGLVEQLESAGVTFVSDLCWCSISEPVLPPNTRVLMTNSAKYAHYAPALCGREVRFGSLTDCVEAAVTGKAPTTRPSWLA